MANIDAEVFKEAGFSYNEIESVRRGIDDVDNGRVYTEEEFYSRLEQRLFSNQKTSV